MSDLDLDELRATYDHPADKSVIEVIDRLEQAEARVKLLESGIVADLVITSVHSASAIGTMVSDISGELLKLGYAGLTERLEKAEQAVQRVREVVANLEDHSRPRTAHKFALAEKLRRALDGDTRG